MSTATASTAGSSYAGKLKWEREVKGGDMNDDGDEGEVDSTTFDAKAAINLSPKWK